MLSSPLTMSPVGFSRCGQYAVCGRLLSALFLSLLVHVLVMLPPLFGSACGGSEGAVRRQEISARLVGATKADSPESDGRLQDVFKEEAAQSAPLEDNDPEIIPSEIHVRAGDSPKPDMDQGLGAGARVLRYFPGDQLTVRPYPLTILEDLGMIEPESDDRGGRIVLKVWISDSGEVAEMETEFTDMPAKVHEAVVAAFRRMRFMPGEIDRKRVGSIMRIEMTYTDFRLPVE